GDTVHRIAIVVALCGMFALPTVASAADVVTLLATTTSQTQKGKTVTFVESLKLGRKTIGVDRIVCNQVRGTIYHCPPTYRLSSGPSTVAGRVNPEKVDNQVRVTGGTKSYKNAGGVLKLHTIDARRTRETFVFNDG